jgi:diadenosine tetraphosphate (Ap4A) HIT family hydrolase
MSGIPRAFQETCEFCDEFTGGVANSFYARYQGSPRARFVLSTSNFHAFPSIGQLVDGYLLVAPRNHYAAFDEMPRTLWLEFEKIHDYVRSTLSSLYGPCLTYEHGARQAGGCGIYHAHMHFVSFSRAVDLVAELKKRFAWRVLPKLTDICEREERPSSYLFCEAPDSARFLFSETDLSSQFMRRLISNALGRDDWDWRAAGREERLLAAIQRLSHQFKGIQNPI